VRPGIAIDKMFPCLFSSTLWIGRRHVARRSYRSFWATFPTLGFVLVHYTDALLPMPGAIPSRFLVELAPLQGQINHPLSWLRRMVSFRFLPGFSAGLLWFVHPTLLPSFLLPPREKKRLPRLLQGRHVQSCRQRCRCRNALVGSHVRSCVRTRRTCVEDGFWKEAFEGIPMDGRAAGTCSLVQSAHGGRRWDRL